MKNRINNSDEDISGKLIFKQIILGNIQAFTRVYNEYYKLLYFVAYKYLMNEEMAKDAVQHVFTKFWESRETLSIDLSLKNYLVTMTKNHILNVIRNENSAIQKNYIIAQSIDYVEDNLLKKIEDSEIRSLLYREIDKLPNNKREICLLKLREELTNQEIADRMNLSINTIKTHYSESLKILRKNLSSAIIILIIITLLS